MNTHNTVFDHSDVVWFSCLQRKMKGMMAVDKSGEWLDLTDIDLNNLQLMAYSHNAL